MASQPDGFDTARGPAEAANVLQHVGFAIDRNRLFIMDPMENSGGTKVLIEMEGALIASRLDLEVHEFRQLMEQRRITVLCERGTGVDVGRYRATFYYGKRRARFVLDQHGRVLSADP